MNCSIISPPPAPNLNLKGSRAISLRDQVFATNTLLSTTILFRHLPYVRLLSSTLTAVVGELQISKVTFMNYHFNKRKKTPNQIQMLKSHVDDDVELM